MTGDWAYILNKLICYNIVDVKSNSELFYTVLDMLSALIHSTLVSDSADSVENSKKPYHVLIKKIKVGPVRYDCEYMTLVYVTKYAGFKWPTTTATAIYLLAIK